MIANSRSIKEAIKAIDQNNIDLGSKNNKLYRENIAHNERLRLKLAEALKDALDREEQERKKKESERIAVIREKQKARAELLRSDSLLLSEDCYNIG